jgi:hypothetical protein
MAHANGTTCPHCHAALAPFALPDTLYDHEYDLACFNDECPYYVRGWAWMEQQFGVRSSYRYRIDSRTGRPSPLAVWSPTAIRSSILPGEAPAGEGEREQP